LKRNGIAYAKTNMSGYQKVVFFFIIACLQGLQYLLAASSNPKTFTEQLLGIREPLELEFCKKLGYSYTAKINFLKENQREAENNKNFKALLRLSKTRCSPLVRHFACSLFAPQLLPKYGVVPPCKSLCLSLTKSCALYLRWASMLTAYSGPCKLTKTGEFFRGDTRKTKGGIECQKWGSQAPHVHRFRPEKFRREGLVKNYCRNPDREPKGPWCYTTSKSTRWAYCDVPMCSVHLHCDQFSDNGCIHYVYDNSARAYQMKVKGTPDKSQMERWISKFSKKEVSQSYNLP